MDNGTVVFGELCYMVSQAKDVRIAHSESEGLRALRTIAYHKYAWPGGYLMVAVTNDGGTICPDCIREDYRQYYVSTRDYERDGWNVQGIFLIEGDGEIEGPMYCDNCGKDLYEI